jgi:outer membrane protein
MGLAIDKRLESVEQLVPQEEATVSGGLLQADTGAASIRDLRQSLDDWLSQAMAHHPALLAARAQVQAARERTTVVQSEGLPTVELTGNLYQNGRPNQGVMPRTRETTLGVSLNIPLFEGFARRYKVAGAQAQLEQKDAELKDVERQVVLELIKAHADATSALNTLDASMRWLDAAKRAQESAQRKFDKGAADVTEILNTQTALTDATLERIRCQADWQSARLRLFANAGKLERSEIRQ